MHGAPLVARAAKQIAQLDHAIADPADIELARAIAVRADPSRINQLAKPIVNFFGRGDHCLIREIRRGPPELVEFTRIEDMLPVLRRVDEMHLCGTSRSGERPLEHRANRRDRRSLRDKADFHSRRGITIEREAAEWPREIKSVADSALEEPFDPAPTRHPVEANLERSAVVRAGRDRVRTRTGLVAERNRYRDELTGDEAETFARGRREKKRTRVQRVIEDSFHPRA